MQSGMERVEHRLNQLSQTTTLRLENLESAVGRLNELIAVFRVAQSDGKLLHQPNGDGSRVPVR